MSYIACAVMVAYRQVMSWLTPTLWLVFIYKKSVVDYAFNFISLLQLVFKGLVTSISRLATSLYKAIF